ncbi:Hypothetical protein D9617_12g035760 [Elsinoe fawcettii]|nr:Hypothetical protein D9617_12g035760 [Elsinoe fawcettii]
MTSSAAPRRSGSRSRRSHPSFSDLRLAPLSTPAPQQEKADKTSMRISLDSPRTPGSVDPSTAHAYKVNHPSYLAGRSAPTTPGILSRSSSRKAGPEGLSRKILYDDDDETENLDPHTSYFDTPSYSAVRVNPQGGIDSSASHMGDRGKSKSESGLSNATTQRARLRPLSTAGPLSKTRTPTTATPRGRSALPARRDEDDWLSHATTFTTSLLQEGKGSAWISSHSSVTNLHSYSQPKSFSAYPASDTSDDENESATRSAKPTYISLKAPHEGGSSGAILSAGGPGQAHRGTAEGTTSPLRSPALAGHEQGWSSRFGSRLNSAANSRRNSRVHLRALSGAGTPYPLSSTSRPGTSGGIPAAVSAAQTGRDEGAMVPDFVDEAARREMESSLAEIQRERAAQGRGQGGYFDSRADADLDGGVEGDDEAEVTRLARTPGFGLGGFGIIDALVGLGGFAPGEEREEEEEGHGVSNSRATGPGQGTGKGLVVRTGGDAAEGLRDEADGLEGNRKRRSVMLGSLQGWFGQNQPPSQQGQDGEGDKEEGGWSDAAWLLSVASRALLS